MNMEIAWSKDVENFADQIENERMTQETFVINVTPKMKEKVKSGIPLFGFGGAIGAGCNKSLPCKAYR